MYTDEQRQTLLQLARDAIAHELYQYVAMSVDPEQHAPSLREVRASFVTLSIETRLRGCIGTLQARQPLVCDVVRNAGAAAFADPRFPRLTREQFTRTDVEISVLSPSEPIEFDSEADLLGQLRPGVDGLILSEPSGAARRSATFLPAVWKQIPEPANFIAQLKRKAGMPADHWSDAITASRYTTESFESQRGDA
ncbi:MAG: AmmeMemoRadiSam system protein A [Phycisphaeraceae bacterium]|nr:AmmeMemoRadiSam system protein A [Phycisphaeraceae bacterium]